MAILHKAELSPTKIDFALAWFDAQPSGGSGPGEIVGQYRFDDPDGEVGVEGLIVRRGDDVMHLPVTYRAAEFADGDLVTTLRHSVLGDRWVTHAASDPVAVACFVRCLEGTQQQATLEVHAGNEVVGRPQPSAVLSVERGDGTFGDTDVDAVETPSGMLRLARALHDDAGPDGRIRLVAEWSDAAGPHRAVVAALG